MYGPNQIIYDLDKQEPVQLGDNVWDKASYPKGRHTHFIAPTGRFWESISEYVVYYPKSIAEAKRLLKENKIAPAPDESRTTEIPTPTVDFEHIRHCMSQYLAEASMEDLENWWKK